MSSGTVAIEINKDQVTADLLESVVAVLRKTLPYDEHLEFEGVLGIRVDRTTEFFVSIRDEVLNIPPIQEKLDKRDLETNESECLSDTEEPLQAPEQVLSVPSLGNLPVGKKFLMPNEDVKHLLEALKDQEDHDMNSELEVHVQRTLAHDDCSNVDVPVDDFQSSGLKEASNVVTEVSKDVLHSNVEISGEDVGSIPEDGPSQVMEYQYGPVEVTEVVSQEDPAEYQKTFVAASSSTYVDSKPAVSVNQTYKKLYKVPKEHLVNPPCDCCHILHRYREKDKNVRKRRRIFEETGQVQPRLPPSKVYKLPLDHVNRCSCCEVLGKKRDYWKGLTRRRRSQRVKTTEPQWIEMKTGCQEES